jgi:hypothetical protein
MIGKEIASKFPENLQSKIFDKVDEWINKEKCGMTFGAKMMIVRKKAKTS